MLACEDKGGIERQAKARRDCLAMFGLKLNVKKTEYLTVDVNENVYAIKVNDLLPSLSQLPDPILPEVPGPGVDQLLDMVVKDCLVAWRDVQRIRRVKHVNVAQLGKLIRGHLFPMGCGVVEEEDLLAALRLNKFESQVHRFYFVYHGLGVHRRASGKQLPVYRSMGADPKAPKVLLAVNISPNEGR
ncbi:unnamed protein product [Heligmosomoides polygyrus]|uniref:Reverse transcriptase domain-containing protein n=1 Tax=Heligmosomoides polygyrus TaxID=6339 RepID=A0A183GDA0_HELPZ|nr:unnamed protein product [Heligmosomoides polygyrus]